MAETKIDVDVVVYTDGSARPNHPKDGFIGCGIHGYFFKSGSTSSRNFNAAKNTFVTNKGYLPNLGEDGSVTVEPIQYFDITASPVNRGTNNQAEILAFIHAVEQIYILAKDSGYNLKSIIHKTDSEYVKKGLTEYLPRWLKTQWLDMEGKPIANKEMWVKCNTLLLQLKELGIAYSVHWVRGNDTIVGNMQADYLSVVAMNLNRTLYHDSKALVEDCVMVNSSRAQGYWNSEVERHPFINFRRLYFNSKDKFNLKGRYFLSDPGNGDTYIGNRDPETGFAVVNLSDNDKIIDLIRNRHISFANDHNHICMINLDRLYDKQIYKYLTNYAEFALLKDSRTSNVHFVDDQAISQELNPSRLAPRALLCFSELEGILEYMDSGIKKPEHESMGFVTKDITDEFYETDSKGNLALKKSFIVGFKKLSIDITRTSTDNVLTMDFKVPIILGLDMPSRNHIKRLEADNPSVHLVTWATSDYCFRYCIYIKCAKGSGVWSNYFSDRIFFIEDKKQK